MKIDNTLYATGVEEWKNTQHSLFSYGIPERYIWEKFEDIVSVLEKLTKVPNTQKLFYPLGAVLEIAQVKAAQEVGCLEFYSRVYSNVYDIIKPKSLHFEAFLDAPQWNYFRLEGDILPQSDVYPTKKYHTEQLAVLPTGQYINVVHSETGEYNGQTFDQPLKKVIRHLEGTFLICSIHSPYNQNSPLYDGKHNTMNSDELRNYVQQKINELPTNN